MITLITGTPRSGKTLFAVSQLVKLKNKYPDRQIYSNIDGLIFDDVLPAPENWADTPEGSIIFYDEAQLIARYADNKKDADSVTKDLSIHGHGGYDIFFITQHPDLLNKYVRNMVGLHYHVSRILNQNYSRLYSWSTCQMNPNAVSIRKSADSNDLFSYPKDLYKYYKSASMHLISRRIPKKFWYALFGLFAVLFFLFYLLKHNSNNRFIKPLVDKSSNSLDSKSNNDANLLKPSSSTSSSLPSVPKFIYDANQPFSQDYSQVEKEVRDFPKVAGCIKSDKSYKCYSQQGTILSISNRDAERIINEGLPFNPFKVQVGNQQEPQEHKKI